MVKVLFVFPNEPFLNPPPVSIAIFNSLLKREKGVELKIFDTTMYQTESVSHDKLKEKLLQVRPFDFKDRGIVAKTTDPETDFVDLVNSYQPDIIAVSCNEATSVLAFSLMRKIKDYPSLKVVGGVYPTFEPEAFLREGLFDFVCRGEGEGVILDLVRKYKNRDELRGIDNLCYMSDCGLVKNQLRPLNDINDLPLPDYDIFEEERFYRPMAGKVWRLFPIETSRGCLYNCTFCNSPSQKRLYDVYGSKNFFRKKSIDIIDEELDYCINELGAEYIYFLSDTLLCMSASEFKRFADMYSRYNIPFWCQNRAEMITYDKVKILKDIGCHRMSIGIEHGNEKFRREVLKKKLSDEAIFRAFDAVNRAGIPVTANNIIGFPGETRELAFDTIKLNRRLKFDTTAANAFTPFHGSELFDVCVKNNLFSGHKVKCISKGTILSMPQFTKKEIDGLIRTFVLYVKMPESYYDRIRKAEESSEEGDAELLMLMEICSELNGDDVGIIS